MKTAGREAGLLKMSELVEASGVPAATIKHYLREGLLPEPIKTSRNMAWYRPETVERIALIRRLQDERFMRPAEVDLLIGDASKAKAKLGWTPKTSFRELVEMMVDSDLALIERQQRAQA